ncbi:hypothetical protein GCM10010215_74450 [Streptomyces virginiae]|nr:hypothetical protein GCM10010215_74450 [Streptomyces virginiae]GLV91471.1 hypothetical protein Slala04_29250 [Streptomyces lavendulae subsp. lavendulae]
MVAVHSAPYRHSASADGGSHSAGSWSAFDRFERAVTTTREAGWPWSFAYASRRRAVHELAPAGGGASFHLGGIPGYGLRRGGLGVVAKAVMAPAVAIADSRAKRGA